MSLQSALLFTAVLCSCVTDLHATAALVKLEHSRSSRNSFHFPTYYVTCYCQCCLTGALCKSCQSILLTSLLITTCNLYLNGIFHLKMDTNRKADTHKAVILYFTAQQLVKESVPAKGSRKILQNTGLKHT